MENVALESGVSSNPCDDSSNKESPRLGASRERALLPYGGGGGGGGGMCQRVQSSGQVHVQCLMNSPCKCTGKFHVVGRFPAFLRQIGQK